MSDFFSRLSQRVLGKAELVRPLVPSRYANGASGEIAAQTPPRSEIDALESTPGDRLAAMSRVQPSVDWQTPPSVKAPPLAQPRAADEIPAGAGYPRPQPPTADQGDSPVPVSAVQASDAVAPRGTWASAAYIPTADQPVALTPPEVDGGQRLETPAAGMREASAAVVGVPDTNRPEVAQPNAGRVAQVLDGEQRPRPRSAGAKSPARRTEPPVMDRRKLESAEPAQRHKTSAQPVQPAIEVRIGRIEVHAAAQPTATAVERPREPSLSLSDYLERRNGGRR